MRKTNLFQLIVLALLSLSVITSCSDDDDFNPDQSENPGDGEDDPEEGAFSEGVFILNEGAQTSGTVSFIGQDFQNVENSIFSSVNPDQEDLGAYLQSVFFDENGRAFIISNGSNLITVVDRNTFEFIGLIDSGLNIPRYGTVHNGKAYVTNQAGFDTGEDDYVAVIDLETLEVEETVNVGAVVENIEKENGLLYIQNATYGSGNRISVFDPDINQVTDTVGTASGLNSMEIENGFIYALSANQLQRIDMTDLSVTDQLNLEYTNESGEMLSAANLEIEDQTIFYTVEDEVYSLDISAQAQAEQPLLNYGSSSAFGVMYGFEVENNHIFIADGGDFASDSYVKIYDLNGNELEEFQVGVGPNGFYFND